MLRNVLTNSLLLNFFSQTLLFSLPSIKHLSTIIYNVTTFDHSILLYILKSDISSIVNPLLILYCVIVLYHLLSTAQITMIYESNYDKNKYSHDVFTRRFQTNNDTDWLCSNGSDRHRVFTNRVSLNYIFHGLQRDCAKKNLNKCR